MGGGGPGDYSIYFASIQLELGEKNHVYSVVPGHEDPQNGTHCGTLAIAPAAQVTQDITFSLAAKIPDNLIYSIVPVLTVDTAQGEQMLALSQLVSTLAFAGVNQFSC
jgi:hypothetical protein